MKLRRIILCMIPVLLTGCASLYSPQQSPLPASVATARIYRDNLALSGRLSVHYQGAQKEEALHGSFNWNQTAAQTSVTLLSPLGQTVAMIDVAPGIARLTQGRQATRTATDVNTLTAQTLGWPLPVAGLRDWLQGFVMTADGHRISATPQNSELTTQDGWQVRYESWQADTTSASNIPKRIDLTRNTPQAGEVAIRIVIDSWQAL